MSGLPPSQLSAKQWVDQFTIAKNQLNVKRYEIQEIQKSNHSSFGTKATESITNELSGLIQDLKRLEEGLADMQSRPARYNVTSAELRRRWEELKNATSEAQRLRIISSGGAVAENEQETYTTYEGFIASEPVKEHQDLKKLENYYAEQLMDQDNQLDELDRVVTRVGDKARLVGDEVSIQNATLEELDRGIVTGNRNLQQRNDEAKNIIKANRNCQLYCIIFILIVILLALVLFKVA